jgi:hypothetical protein
MVMTAQQPMSSTEKRKAVSAVNRGLTLLCRNRYHDGLPVQDVLDLLHSAGFSETEELVGVYCGREGRVHEHVGSGVYLLFSWFKMEETGRYEVNAYVS